MLFFKKYYMISRAYSKPNPFFIEIPCILPKHDREGGMCEFVEVTNVSRARNSSLPRNLSRSPPRRARIFANDLKCPAMRETRTFHEKI